MKPNMEINTMNIETPEVEEMISYLINSYNHGHNPAYSSNATAYWHQLKDERDAEFANEVYDTAWKAFETERIAFEKAQDNN